MNDDATWAPLRAELDRWTDAGRSVRLWFRDDDAVEPTAALDRLLGMARAYGIPLTLAVIPAPTGERLADHLRSESLVSVAVHGWSHQNYAPASAKKQELGLTRPIETTVNELRLGREKLEALYPQQFQPMLVPPWNRIAPPLLDHLADIGYRAVSVYGAAATQAPIARVNTHVDIIDWHGTRGGWPHTVLVKALLAELASRFEGSEEPIGIVTHHLVHDETAWSFIGRLFEETAGRAAIRWCALPELLG